MIGIKMLASSIEHSWAADEKKVSQQVEQWLLSFDQQHMVRICVFRKTKLNKE